MEPKGLNWPSPTSESWATRLIRWKFNRSRVYGGTGGHILHIAGDWSDLRIRLPLNRRTRNYVGTIYGGSMYACVDPLYMVMLINLLGKDYTVWDKSATIRFRKPGKTTLYARFSLDGAELDTIRQALETERSIDRAYTIELVDAAGAVHAEVEKIIYIRRKTTLFTLSHASATPTDALT